MNSEMLMPKLLASTSIVLTAGLGALLKGVKESDRDP